MSLRHQLLLVALTTLMLPWAGCEYARELETAGRVAQENALAASADTIAHALSAEPARVFGGETDAAPFDPAQGDLYVYPLHDEPLLDGYRDDWDLTAEPNALPPHGGYVARLLAGRSARYLYLYVEAADEHIVPEPAALHPIDAPFTRVEITLEASGGDRSTYFFASPAPGPIAARTIARDDPGTGNTGVDTSGGGASGGGASGDGNWSTGDSSGREAPRQIKTEPRIQGFWLQTTQGYHLEARLPLALVGPRLWVAARTGSGDSWAGCEPGATAAGGRLVTATPGLGELLATFIRPGTRASVVDANALKLGSAGALDAGTPDETQVHASWYRTFMAVDSSRWPQQILAPDRIESTSVTAALKGLTHAEWLRTSAGGDIVLEAAAPIEIEGRTRGAVVLEQPGSQLLDLRDRALGHLIDLTLLATALAVVLAFAVAASIGLTIGRLRNAADSAVSPDGRIRLTMPESGRSDEIGALARAFERLLARLNEHTLYLRSLGGKLSHELRTPLTIVRSSLENLESEGVRPEERGYLERAREGVARLQFILNALGAAARVEEGIKQAERTPVDLAPLLASAVAGYRDAFPGVEIELETPPDACPARVAPELIVQLLDKLIDNASDFCPPDGRITVRLARERGEYALTVSNDGPPIPPEVQDRLFESLFEHRPGRDEKPHFGLGLYIVRLIADFHEGRASAANRDDGSGAVFTVTLPLI